MNDQWAHEVRLAGARIRRRAFEVCARRRGGYLIQVCGSADILATLYLRLMNLGPSRGPSCPPKFESVPRPARTPHWGGIYNGSHDRFFMSPAHYALSLYSTLVEAGRVDPSALDEADNDGSTLELIGAEHSPGFESTSGSLGQALSVAVGSALARKAREGAGHIWAFVSDGELEEGQTWEALQAAVNFGLGNLTILLDANGMQVDGWVKSVMNIEPIVDKVRAFGCHTLEVDGHDPAAIAEAVEQRAGGKPQFVVCRTVCTTGIESLRGRHQLHYIRFRPGEIEAARADLEAFRMQEASA